MKTMSYQIENADEETEAIRKNHMEILGLKSIKKLEALNSTFELT